MYLTSVLNSLPPIDFNTDARDPNLSVNCLVMGMGKEYCIAYYDYARGVWFTMNGSEVNSVVIYWTPLEEPTFFDSTRKLMLAIIEKELSLEDDQTEL
jgi:hypothetical protein